MGIDQSLKRKRGRQASSLSAKTKMGQTMPSVHQRLALSDSSSSSSSKIDKDDDFEPTDEELAIVVGKQSIASDDCDDPDGEVDYVPLRMVRPETVESEQENLRSIHQILNAKNTSTGITNTYKRKRRRPAGSQSAKRKMEQKPALVDGSSSSSSESNKDDDFVPMVSDVNGQKKCASVQGSCGSAWARALEVKAKLPAEDPSFAKRMLPSHVVRGFWLGLPSDFCKEHLPKHDVIIALEDEDGHSYDAKYLGYKLGLSGGWRDFAIQHGIKVGDAVVFQLVRATRFKVYILRENKFATTDGALGLLSLGTSKENNVSKEKSSDDDDVKSKEDPEVNRVSSKAADDDSNNLASEEAVDDSIRFSESDIDFDEVTCFSNFNIIVDGVVIDRQLPKHPCKTYYELCCARKSFLHKHLLKQMNLTLTTGVIMETTNIAEGIRACNSSHEDLAVWKKTLESFELLGMDVEFLRKRVDDLVGLLPSRSSRDHSVAEREEYKEVKIDRARAREKMRALESKMSNLKNALEEMDAEMEEMESSVKKNMQAMRKMATAPW